MSTKLKMTALSFITLLSLGLNAATTGQAQSDINRQQAALPRNALVGSWIETITPQSPGAPPPFKSLGVFNQDGTSVFSDQGGVLLKPG